MSPSFAPCVTPHQGPQRGELFAGGPNVTPTRRVGHVLRALAPSTPDVALKRNAIGQSDLVASEVCLGTMVFGSQVPKPEALNVMEYAYDCGVNFFDTAEMYSVPHNPAHQGESSRILGEFLKGKKREEVAVATKVLGRGPGAAFGFIAANRTDPPGEPTDTTVDRASIKAAVEGELRRLGTDYIDLMQIHWPDRYVPLFGSTHYDASKETDYVSFEEQVETMGELIKEGKIRHWGLSNETTFGTTMHCVTADRLGVPRPISIQKNYSLTLRTVDTELAEAVSPQNFNIGLLPYFAAGAGSLSGKYLSDKRPEGARLSLWSSYLPRFVNPRHEAAVAEYIQIAEAAGMTSMQLAYLFCKSRPFIPSTIVGATSIEQIKENLEAFGMELNDDVRAAIEEVHRKYPNPQIIE